MTILQTALGALVFEQVKPDEMSIVMEIIEEAATWLHARGITKQWPSPIPEQFWERMKREIAKGEVYIACLADGSAVGTFRFAWMDEDLWLQDPAGGGYVHTFAIRNGAHGHRVGAAMIEWAKKHVRERGKKFLRLDCWGDNHALCEYYRGLGFTFCGLVREKDWVDALFQMQV